MNALIDNFHLLAAAPNGVAKLRELILSLAVRGKLVPQDPNDEPASELLKKIAAENARLIKEGKIKKDKPLPEIAEDEKPYALPLGWEWVRLGDAVEVLDSLRKPVTKQDREPGPYPYYGASGVVDYVSNFIFDEPLVLVGEDGAKWGRGEKTAFAISGKTWVNNHAHVLRPFRTALSDLFLVCTLVEMDLQHYITGMTVPKLNQARLNAIVLPLPPLAEQHRIVAKVDELMQLCDQLETQQTVQGEGHERLVVALLDSLTQSVDAQAFADNWSRLADYFELLFDTPESIAKLKQTLLQIAVQGKLVPQDPNDEPASELLKKIAAEKACSRPQEGRIKKDKMLSEITADEEPYSLPQGWEWVRVASIFKTSSGNTFDASLERNFGSIAYVKVGDMNLPGNELEITTSSRFIEPDERAKSWIIPTGSIIFPKRGGAIATNKKRIVGRPIFADLNIMAITPMVDGVETRYAYIWLSTIDLAKLNTGTSVPQINHKDVDPLKFPLPSTAEQRRIIAKVDELMLVCDALAERLARSRDLAAKLMETVVFQSSE